MNDFLIGEKIRGYTVEKKLGEGGFGKVYLAVHPTIERRAAIKVLHREFSDNEVVIERFISEAKAVNKINHPNIIQIFDFDTLEDGRFYFMMEYIDGVELSSLMARSPRLTLPEILTLLEPITRGLDAAHKSGIVHRDLKPDNIMVFKGWESQSVKLLDFGIAKLTASKGDSQRTKTGQLLGTPAYMSPEQAKGEKEQVTHLSDIYSLGVILYEMLSGQLPVSGDSVMKLLLNIVSEQPRELTQLDPSVPPGVSSVILRALSKDPAERQQSATELYADLLAAANEAGMDVKSAPHPSTAVTVEAQTPPRGHEDASSANTLPAVNPLERASAELGTAPPPEEPQKAAQSFDKNSKKTKETDTRTHKSVGKVVALTLSALGVVISLLGIYLFVTRSTVRQQRAHEAPTWRLARFTSTSMESLAFVVPGTDFSKKAVALEKNLIYLDGEIVGVYLAATKPSTMETLHGHLSKFFTIYAPPSIMCSKPFLRAIRSNSKRAPLFLSFLREKGWENRSCLNELASLPLYIQLHDEVGPFYYLHLKKFKDLRGLIIEGSSVTDATLAYIKKQNALQHLVLRNTRVTDKGLSSLARLFALTHLNLSHTPTLQGTGFSALASLKRLRHLDLSHTKIRDVALASLPRLPSLRELNLISCTNLTDEGLTNLRPMPLEHLSVGGFVERLKLEADPLGTVGKLFTLESKDFLKKNATPGDLINSKGVKAVKDVFGKQKPLLSGITAKGIAMLSAMPRLTHLTLGTVAATPAELLTALSKMERMTWLRISNFKSACPIRAALVTARPGLTLLSDCD